MSATIVIIVVTSLVSILAFQNRDIMNRFIFNPHIIYEHRQYYRFISSGMIHADWIHLFFNMFVLYSIGTFVEEAFKSIFENRAILFFLCLYFGGMIASVIPTFLKNRHKPEYNALGASGAVSAVVFAFILFQPLEPIYLYGIIRLPGVIFGGLYLAYCYYAGRRGGDNINHDAHLWGAVFGFLFPITFHPWLFSAFLNQLPFLHSAF